MRFQFGPVSTMSATDNLVILFEEAVYGECGAIDTRVTFVFQFSSDYRGFVLGHLKTLAEKEFSNVVITFPVDRGPHLLANLVFSRTVSGQLRNPAGFLRATKKKIQLIDRQAWSETQAEEDRYEKEVDEAVVY